MRMAIMLLVAALLFGGCATHDRATIAAVRAAGVSPRTVAKLERGGPLAPEEVIELRRRGVSDAVPLRQLNEHAVDYIVQREDIARLRGAGVRPAVREALIEASDRFARERRSPRRVWYDPWWDFGYGDPLHGCGDPFWWPQTRVLVGYVFGGRHHRCR